ncbi:MAG: NAD(P)-dependent alcohol dehydrogenase [Cyclobacteriaceae bacterium]
MRSIVVTNDGSQYDLTFQEKPIPEVKDGYCLVKLHSAALNRRDYWISVGKYPGIKHGVTLGSDGCGEVIEGDPNWVGQTVLINPNINWGEDPMVQSSGYMILGTPTDGTFAEYIVVPAHRLSIKPRHLGNTEAAAVPLAGLTAFRAVTTKGNVKENDKVLITGIGGGVSQFALSFALHLGAEVCVTSSSDEKIDSAIRLGARHGFNYGDDQWIKRATGLAGKFDVIIDSAGGNAINDYLRLVKPSGKVVVYGSTTGKTQELDLFRLFWSQVSLVGSTMGNDDEFQQMIAFVDQHKIKPTVDQVYPFKEGIEAIRSMATASQFGKTMLKMDV